MQLHVAKLLQGQFSHLIASWRTPFPPPLDDLSDKDFLWLLSIPARSRELIEAKSNALSILILVKFDEKGLIHICCHLGSASNRPVLEDEFWETFRLIEVDRQLTNYTAAYTSL
jgi:hypothetical protein